MRPERGVGEERASSLDEASAQLSVLMTATGVAPILKQHSLRNFVYIVDKLLLGWGCRQNSEEGSVASF